MHRETTRVVVLGAGYAGLRAALRIARRTRRENVRVELINAADTFVERIRLHQLATGQRLARRPIRAFTRGTGIEFRPGVVSRLDPTRHEVVVESDGQSRSVSYDYLVYALGSTAMIDRVPGAREHALTVAGEADALRARDALRALPTEGARVAVCGGGLTGIEVAAEVAQAYPRLRVQIVTSDELGARLSGKGRAYLRQTFEHLGIEVVEHAKIREVRANALAVDGRPPIPFDLCLWAGGFVAHPLAGEAGLPVNERGQVLVDPYLRAVTDPSIFVAGDAASVRSPDVPIRMACATALPLGGQVADNLVAAIGGRALAAFHFGYAIQCISLGRGNGLVQFVRSNDEPTERILTGRLAAWTKELICRGTVWFLTLERRWPGADRWPWSDSRQTDDADRENGDVPAEILDTPMLGR